MNILESILLAIGLSMDAFAVAICCGLSLQKISFRAMASVGVCFGLFQAVMPLGGYWLGNEFQQVISKMADLVAPLILGAIGGNMVVQSYRAETDTKMTENGKLPSLSAMLLLGIATSIDAFVVGISFVFLEIQVIATVCLIGGITCACSMGGVKIGQLFGSRYKSIAERFGGFILICIGLRAWLLA